MCIYYIRNNMQLEQSALPRANLHIIVELKKVVY